MASTPMGPDAKLVVRYTPDSLSTDVVADLDDGNGNRTTLAEIAPTATPEQFEWLVRSAASFHKIGFEVDRGDS